MKGFKKIIPILLLFPFTLISCNNVSDTIEIPVGEKDSSMFSSGDLKEFKATDYDQKIDLSNLNANYAITKSGVYYFKGTTNYQLIINDSSTSNVHIILDNVTFNNDTTASIYVKKSAKVVIHLLGNNTITSTYLNEVVDGDDTINGAIYSKDDLTISGSGNLNIKSALNGIVCNDDFKLVSGNVNIDSVNKGIDVNDSFRMRDGNLTINSSTNSGIKLKNSSDNPFLYVEGGVIDITSYKEGIDLDYNTLATGYMKFVSGDISIKSGNTENISKGIKSANSIIITGGKFNIDSTDDGLHATGDIDISNCNINIKSDDDCIHSDTLINIKSGSIILTGHEGLESSNTIVIDGGNIKIDANDDGINSSDNITINGGFIDITLGDGDVDGIDSNGEYLQTGGIVISRIPVSSLAGAGAVDASLGVKFLGGTFIGVGTFTTLSTITTSIAMKHFDDTFSSGAYSVEGTNIKFDLSSSYKKLTIVSSELNIGSSYKLLKDGAELLNWSQTTTSE